MNGWKQVIWLDGVIGSPETVIAGSRVGLIEVFDFKTSK